MLAAELADLAPSQDLLATVRTRYARSRKTLRASAAALAFIAAGAVTAAAIISASPQHKAAAQPIVLDNYAFSLSRQLHPAS